ncbi:hypothetical protein BJY01DRAFT_81612 [Aspergillus pseudoustus]|uniref:C2H2-type domain-containing protein n=1 Tax=Aspergillus pseudoustus TaxID=1810923 RepID=A0ABR4J3L4_9EURO
MLLRRKRILYRHSRYAKSPLKGAAPEGRIVRPVSTTAQLEPQKMHPETETGTGESGSRSQSTPAPSVASTQANTATTFDLEYWKKVSTSPSVVSRSTTVQLADDQRLSFPGPPNRSLRQRLEAMKTNHLSNLDRELESLPHYKSYQEHNHRPPLEPTIIADLVKSVNKLTTRTSTMIDDDRKACEAGSMEVTCPYCCCVISSATAMSKDKWADHVKHDIDPYVCLFEDCDAPDVLYGHSQSWLKHMRQHSKRWRCPAKSHEPLVFETQPEYETHMVETHKVHGPQVLLMIQRHCRSSGPLFESCPLCGASGPNLSLESHIAGHLVHLALKSLPSFDDDVDSEDMDEVGSRSDRSNPQAQDNPQEVKEPNTRPEVPRLSKDPIGTKQMLKLRVEELHKPMLVPSSLIVPTFDGFSERIVQDNPSLSRILIQRFASEQVHRYRRLLENQKQHNFVASIRECSSGEYCLAQGGSPKLLRPGAEKPLMSRLNILPPRAVKGLPSKFECSWCFRTQTIHKGSEWATHVLEDLQPYTCTFHDCKQPPTFKIKEDWIRHEGESHRRLEWWECDIMSCHYRFYVKLEYIRHLSLEHHVRVPSIKTDTFDKRTGGELWATLDRNHNKTTRTPSTEPCCFCGNVASTWRQHIEHLARHLEQMALPVLSLLQTSV